MSLEILLLVLLAFGIFLVRFIMLKQEQRRRAALTLLLTGAAGSGLLAGLLGLDDDFGLAVTGVIALEFALAAALAYWLGREPKQTKFAGDLQGFMPEERHDYTKP